jgi:hypothetical protein
MPTPRATALALAACSLLACVGVGAAAGVPTYPCFRAPEPPVIDGEVRGDAAWEAVPGATGFRVLGGDYAVQKQATGFACYDDEHLYVAMLCEEPDIELVRSVMKDGDDLWAEDSVEIFVEPTRGGLVYQFVVTAGGSRQGAEAMTGLAGWQAAAQRTEGGYGVELLLPFELFGVEPAAQSCHIAFCRNIWTYDSGGDKFTTWPALTRRFLEPENFAALEFQPTAASPAQREHTESVLSGDYRASLAQQVTALAPAAGEYLPVLTLAAADEGSGLRREARRVIQQWRQVERLARTVPEAAVARLREAAGQASALRQTSYDLKYRYLLEQLLEDIRPQE